MKIRSAGTADVPVILQLIRGLAEYERAPHEVAIGEAELLRDGFGKRPLFECLIADLNSEPVGMALFFPIYSTWKGASIHLEDLFVLPAARGLGIGKALLKRVASIAGERGAAAMGCAGLESAGYRFLSIAGGEVYGRVANHAGDG